ncbi:hypothetical protein DFH11DRAFT_1808333 [Phellopilus nigrolimitatus]|nr:hypothetical protein DFH11DRAFT_1808333 [Phellopilus nigrolimitatus]
MEKNMLECLDSVSLVQTCRTATTCMTAKYTCVKRVWLKLARICKIGGKSAEPEPRDIRESQQSNDTIEGRQAEVVGHGAEGYFCDSPLAQNDGVLPCVEDSLAEGPSVEGILDGNSARKDGVALSPEDGSSVADKPNIEENLEVGSEKKDGTPLHGEPSGEEQLRIGPEPGAQTTGISLSPEVKGNNTKEHLDDSTAGSSINSAGMKTGQQLLTPTSNDSSPLGQSQEAVGTRGNLGCSTSQLNTCKPPSEGIRRVQGKESRKRRADTLDDGWEADSSELEKRHSRRLESQAHGRGGKRATLDPENPKEERANAGARDIAENAQHYGGSAKTQTAIFFTQPSSQPSSIEEGISRRFFLDRANKCSMEEVVNLYMALNWRIDTLVLDVLDEWDKVPVKASGKEDAPVNFDVPTIIVAGRDTPLELNIANLVRKALGNELYRSITGLKPEDSELDACVYDALQVWAVFCIHLAIKPLLFGFKVRTMSEVEEAFRQIVDHDFDEYCLLEETFQQILECLTGVHADNGSQAIALHWRALLHSYDRRLGSFSDAFEKTSEVLCEGFLEVFTLAGKVPPPSLIDDVRVLASKNRVVEHASQLAETVKTGFFSVNLEVFIADPGSLYDDKSMLLDGQEHNAGEAAIVKGTIGLGLREILPVTPDSGTETKGVLLKSKVLLYMYVLNGVASDVLLLHAAPTTIVISVENPALDASAALPVSSSRAAPPPPSPMVILAVAAAP